MNKFTLIVIAAFCLRPCSGQSTAIDLRNQRGAIVEAVLDKYLEEFHGAPFDNTVFMLELNNLRNIDLGSWLKRHPEVPICVDAKVGPSFLAVVRAKIGNVINMGISLIAMGDDRAKIAFVWRSGPLGGEGASYYLVLKKGRWIVTEVAVSSQY